MRMRVWMWGKGFRIGKRNWVRAHGTSPTTFPDPQTLPQILTLILILVP
jgi:hypothetical protein